MPLLASHRGGRVERAASATFRHEREMQNFLSDLPGLIPMDDIAEGTELLVLAREFGTAAGPIDGIGVDQSGALYLIETKLRRNSDRRRVLAQVLDYGAALWQAGEDPDAILNRLERKAGDLRAAVSAQFDLSNTETEALLDATRQHLRDGTFRFVVVMDKVDDAFLNLIDYVNTSSSFDVLAVELDLYRLDDLTVIIPRMHGARTRKTTAPTSAEKRMWTEEDFFPALAAAHGPVAEQAARRLYAWGEDIGRIEWQPGALHGGFQVAATMPNASVSLFKVSEDGRLRVYSARFAGAFGTTEARWEALRSRLATVGFDLPEDPSLGRKLHISFLDADPSWAQSITNAFDWVVANLDRP